MGPELFLIKEELWRVVAKERPAEADIDAAWFDGKATSTICLLLEENQVRQSRSAWRSMDFIKNISRENDINE